MARKKSHGGHENLERWLVSYADLLTLMFALFVVLFASSQSDKGKAQRMAESVRKALEEGKVTTLIAGILGGSPSARNKSAGVTAPKPPKPEGAQDPKALAELLPSLDYLTRQLEPEISAGKLQVHMEPRGLVISLTEAAFFESGDARIMPATYDSLEKIAGAIVKLPNPVRLEGHSDSVPIHNSRFASNWELSSARGIAMLELLSTRFKLPVSRLAVAAYADNAPLATNDTEEGRAKNRRVDIVILNKTGYDAEPQNKGAPAG